MAVHFGAELDKDRSTELPCRASPRAEVLVEIPVDDGLHGKGPFGFPRLVVLGPQHQANVGDSAVGPDPIRRSGGKRAALVPVVREIHPGHPLAAGRLVSDHILQGDIVLLAVDTTWIDSIIELSGRRRQKHAAVSLGGETGGNEKRGDDDNHIAGQLS